MKNIPWEKITEIASRWYVFVFLNLYGSGKIAGGQFYRRGALPPEVAQTTLEQATAYELAWSFMGYSFYYILFIGSAQIIGAWLLLWERSKLLGVMILLPIMVNIIVFDLIFLEVKDALVNALLYFGMLLYILYANRSRIASAWWALTQRSDGMVEDRGPARWQHWLLALLLMALVFGLDQLLVNVVRSRG